MENDAKITMTGSEGLQSLDEVKNFVEVQGDITEQISGLVSIC